MANDRKREDVCFHVTRLLRAEREQRGISMNVLAQRSGLSQSMISLIERDLRNPTLDTLLRIADALEIDLPKVIQRAQAAAGKNR